jgi:hypothetical protein
MSLKDNANALFLRIIFNEFDLSQFSKVIVMRYSLNERETFN